MLHKNVLLCTCLLLICCVVRMSAQQAPASTNDGSSVIVPPIVNFGGVLLDVNGKPLTGVTGVTFALYKDSQGGAPLWQEMQNVYPDKTGHYTVMLGSTRSAGIPSQLFASGEARWLAVQSEAQPEQPRVLLISVPYALKALDAETIGGRPASAFMLANPIQNTATPTTAISAGARGTAAPLPPNIGASGTAGYIARWTSHTNLGNSALFQSSDRIGLSTISPTQKLEVDSGNMLVKGVNNFHQSGDTAYLYVGDTSHSIEALWGQGIAIGTYKVPQAIFVHDKTGNVGIGITTPSDAALSTQANSVSNTGASILGFSASTGSGLHGTDSIHATGGNADPNAKSLSGGAGLVATGGSGSATGTPGPGIVANGGALIGGETVGADAIDASGGAGGGYGITATGGGLAFVGGDGGAFIAGNGSIAPGDGIFALADTAGYAGQFDGDINVTGAIFAGTKDFKIDHPLDPANKYLIHASVESSEMMNIYTGNVMVDDRGEATIQLPNWFEALNGDFRYQLTAIGRSSPGLYVAQEISNNQFHIAGGSPGTKVSWQVTGVRHDVYANANPLVVERQKTYDRGYYIHPELYGASEGRGIEWSRHPAFMKRLKELRTKQAGKAQDAHLHY